MEKLTELTRKENTIVSGIVTMLNCVVNYKDKKLTNGYCVLRHCFPSGYDRVSVLAKAIAGAGLAVETNGQWLVVYAGNPHLNVQPTVLTLDRLEHLYKMA